jgi:hypothetical protein
MIRGVSPPVDPTFGEIETIDSGDDGGGSDVDGIVGNVE